MRSTSIPFSQLRALLMQYDAVSFDLFDTLAVRNCSSFRILWKLVEERADAALGVPTCFQHDREAAELMAYRAGNASPDLRCIYAQMPYPEKTRRYLRELEQSLEYELIEPSFTVRRIYALCRELGKPVYVVSDTYYSADFLRKLLAKCGYRADGILASCEEGCVKRSGKLFGVLTERFHLSPARVLHFGDSVSADIQGAARAGIDAVRITAAPHTHYLHPAGIGGRSDADRLYHFINNRLPFQENRAVRVGYETLGPVVLGTCQWLHAVKASTGASAILFCARDARLLYEWYRRLYPEDTDCTHYFHVSLQSLSLPYRSTKDTSDADAAAQADLLRRYVRQLTDSRQLLLADSGFGGHTQHMLQRVLGTEYRLHGAYIRMSRQFTERAAADHSAQAYLFRDAPSPKARISGAFFETLLQAQEGRTLSYRLGANGRIEPVLDAVREQNGCLRDIHKWVDRFIKEWTARGYLRYPIDTRLIQDAFLNLTFFPETADVACLAGLRGGNRVTVPVIEDCGNAFAHPVRFLRGLQSTYWKGGYLSQCFRHYKCVSRAYLLADCAILEIRGY